MRTRVVMTQRTTVERISSTADTGGGFTDAWGTVASDVPCRAFALRTRSVLATGVGTTEQITGERPGVQELKVVLVPISVDVREGDRLTAVVDRKGVTLFRGPMLVDSIGDQHDHRRLTTRRIV